MPAASRHAKLKAMERFSAVATTGIYCRPGCGARPHPRNVRRYVLAAAAEAAGYRACMRCRPYRDEVATSGIGPELVCRAVQLILDGILDGDGNESALGTRLGVSPRHLRRIFNEHLGVTPDQLARCRRAHFARRLLDDTDLTLTEIAFAAGYGSVRQCSRSLQEVFRASPAELRARRRTSDRLVADGGLTLRLPFKGPLAWDDAAAYFALRAIPGVELATPDCYRRTIVAEGHPGVLELFPGDEDHLVLRLHLGHWGSLVHLVQRARRIFNLDADTEAAVCHLCSDRVLGAIVRARPGVRPSGAWDPFETGVRAIIGQQVSVRGASTITGRLVARCGTAVPGLAAFGLTHLFPSPETVADQDLSGLGFPGARAVAISRFARAVAADEVRLDRSIPLEALAESIAAIRGLGSWTAQYLALRLGEPDAFPATDLGLKRAIGELTPADPGELAEAWRPFRAHAAAHLWTALAGAPARRSDPAAGRAIA